MIIIANVIGMSRSGLPADGVGGRGVANSPAGTACGIQHRQQQPEMASKPGKSRGKRTMQEGARLDKSNFIRGLCNDEFTEEELLAMEGSESSGEIVEGDGEEQEVAVAGAGDPQPAHEEGDDDMFGEMLKLEVGDEAEYMDLVADDFTPEELWAIGVGSESDDDGAGGTTLGIDYEGGTPTSKGKLCHATNCERSASYGPYQGAKVACKRHKMAGDTLLTGRKCTVRGCSKQPSYGPVGSREERCSAHRAPGDLSLVKRCEVTECEHKAVFGPALSKSKRAVRCSQHQADGDIRVAKVQKTICRAPGCTVAASFTGSSGLGKAEYCKGHAQAGSVNARGHRRCSFGEGCTKIASFGDAVQGRQGSMYCAKHRGETDIDVVSRLCKHAGCSRRATFGCVGKPKDACRRHWQGEDGEQGAKAKEFSAAQLYPGERA